MLWDVGSGKCLKKLTGHTEIVYSLDFSKESSILVSGSADKTIRIWDVLKGISVDSVDVYEIKFTRRNLCLAAGAYKSNN
ncbi:2987_t:CDS:2 [Entrophospora sp. SA101]|nr:2987_t:CDS:2 [Entrophospora sp. SA101]